VRPAAFASGASRRRVIPAASFADVFWDRIGILGTMLR
jgi:hypothetical protein